MEFKTRLKQLREENAMLQKDLAKKIDVDRSTITAYESGRIEPDLSKLKKLSDIFDCSVDYLIGTSDVKSKADAEYIIYYDKNEEKKLRLSDVIEIYKIAKNFPK